MGDCCSFGELEAHALEECGQMAYLVDNDREGSGEAVACEDYF